MTKIPFGTLRINRFGFWLVNYIFSFYNILYRCFIKTNFCRFSGLFKWLIIYGWLPSWILSWLLTKLWYLNRRLPLSLYKSHFRDASICFFFFKLEWFSEFSFVSNNISRKVYLAGIQIRKLRSKFNRKSIIFIIITQIFCQIY